MEYDEMQRAKGLQGAGERGACSHMGVYTHSFLEEMTPEVRLKR